MTILNIHAGSLPSFALRMKPTDSLTTLRQRAAAKVRLQLSDGIPLAVKYGWNGQRYGLEDDDDWEIFTERVGNQAEADGESWRSEDEKHSWGEVCRLNMSVFPFPSFSHQSTSLHQRFLTRTKAQDTAFQLHEPAPWPMCPSSTTPLW